MGCWRCRSTQDQLGHTGQLDGLLSSLGERSPVISECLHSHTTTIQISKNENESNPFRTEGRRWKSSLLSLKRWSLDNIHRRHHHRIATLGNYRSTALVNDCLPLAFPCVVSFEAWLLSIGFKSLFHNRHIIEWISIWCTCPYIETRCFTLYRCKKLATL